MLSFFLLLPAGLVQQSEDFEAARTEYEAAVGTPTEAMKEYAARVQVAEARVAELEQKLTEHQAQLAALDRLEVERYLALKANFSGPELEAKLAEEARQIGLRRASLEETLRMERLDLDDARRRLSELQMEYRLARIEAGLLAPPRAPRNDAPPLAEQYESRSQALLLQRARSIGRFAWHSVPASWLGRGLDLEKGQ